MADLPRAKRLLYCMVCGCVSVDRDQCQYCQAKQAEVVAETEYEWPTTNDGDVWGLFLSTIAATKAYTTVYGVRSTMSGGTSAGTIGTLYGDRISISK